MGKFGFGDRPRRMLLVIRHFGKHRCCHLQGEYVHFGRFSKQTVGGPPTANLYALTLKMATVVFTETFHCHQD
jgi:hypothetical protein